jgi:hypothetical protein
VLLLLFGVAFSICSAIVGFVLRQQRRRLPEGVSENQLEIASNSATNFSQTFLERPTCWLAIRSGSLAKVQTALGLHNPKTCSLAEGLAGGEKLFITPPVNGWILVLGESLPEPRDDIDVCHRFVLNLSRKLGEVQFFNLSRLLRDHAWVCADRGRVVRAYAWAGKTLWKQGARTSAEKELELKCVDYFESQECGFSESDFIASNLEKVPLLAARWSLDPACIGECCHGTEPGIAGELSRRY